MKGTAPLLSIIRNILPRGMTEAERLLEKMVKECDETGNHISQISVEVARKYLVEDRDDIGDEAKRKYAIDLPGIVCFCVLMEGDGGILERSPRYIWEKMERCLGGRKVPWSGLDALRKEKVLAYIKKWPTCLDWFHSALPDDSKRFSGVVTSYLNAAKVNFKEPKK